MTSTSPAGRSHCTSGFVFDKWTTRERLVSTAFHCNFAAEGSPTTFFTASSSGRKLVGTMQFTAPVGHQAADVMLLRAASGTSFNNPTVYVGPSDKRTVGAYVQSVGQGQVAAKYGGTTGLLLHYRGACGAGVRRWKHADVRMGEHQLPGRRLRWPNVLGPKRQEDHRGRADDHNRGHEVLLPPGWDDEPDYRGNGADRIGRSP